jgi:hypothetical protein
MLKAEPVSASAVLPRITTPLVLEGMVSAPTFVYTYGAALMVSTSRVNTNAIYHHLYMFDSINEKKKGDVR